MTRTVICSRYGEELEGLDKPPLPGPNGERIFNEVSRKAWNEWQALQTMLINEKHLKLIDPEARKYLTEQMWKFFANEEVDRADGYIAPDS
jgi:Fe-S cluster biosynthesis and repair protein YggX